jgi:hypothetical protein
LQNLITVEKFNAERISSNPAEQAHLTEALASRFTHLI